ncbi:unnamed protein product [Heterobilharzia americana]|nr:unnamed protein product [Heterobilharzia americana]CAH8612666.1 unnamed protein product [Heterobilharzia americana]
MENSDDDSTSDEEYVPPVKASRIEGDSESEYSEDTESENAITDDDSSVKKSSKRMPAKRKSRNVSKISDSLQAPSAEDIKAHEDKVWEEFLKSEAASKSDVDKKVNVVRKYQFAGEEVEVTETISKTASVTKNSNISLNQNNTAKTEPPKPKAPSIGVGLSAALQNLKSTINKLPKLSTLEKSRLDWKQYVQKESLEDDLKAHNKGKEGYLERQAFVHRTSEREHQYHQELKKPTSSRRI